MTCENLVAAPKAQRQQTRSPKDRACRWPAFSARIKQALDLLQCIIAGQAQRLIQQDDAMQGATWMDGGTVHAISFGRRRGYRPASLALSGHGAVDQALSSAARSVVRSKWKCSVGTVLDLQALNRLLWNEVSGPIQAPAPRIFRVADQNRRMTWRKHRIRVTDRVDGDHADAGIFQITG